MILLKRKKYNDLLDEWLGEEKYYIKESTFATYNIHIKNHIKPYFDYMYVTQITHDDIQKFIDFKLKNGRLDGKGGLTVKTVKDLVNVIKLSLNYAVEKNYIKEIDFDFKFQKVKKEIKILSSYEFDILIDFLKNKEDFFYKGIILILCTGIRIGEICALKNSDINLIEKEIYINKTLQRIQDVINHKTKIIITNTKTINSTRVIPIPDSLCPYLNLENNNNYFLTQSLKYMEPRVFRYRFKNMIKKLNISNVTVHSLRHYFASQCIELGFDYNCLSEILGHSSPTTTMNLYVHSKKEYKKNCMDKIKF